MGDFLWNEGVTHETFFVWNDAIDDFFNRGCICVEKEFFDVGIFETEFEHLFDEVEVLDVFV